MIQLSANAVGAIKEIMARYEGDYALRIQVIPGGCCGLSYRMLLDNETEADDNVIEFDHFKVLIDPVSAQYLEGTQIDFTDTPEGQGFVFDNPQGREGEHACGCGNGGGHEAAGGGCGCGRSTARTGGGCGCHHG